MVSQQLCHMFRRRTRSIKLLFVSKDPENNQYFVRYLGAANFQCGCGGRGDQPSSKRNLEYIVHCSAHLSVGTRPATDLRILFSTEPHSTQALTSLVSSVYV